MTAAVAFPVTVFFDALVIEREGEREREREREKKSKKRRKVRKKERKKERERETERSDASACIRLVKVASSVQKHQLC